MESKIAFSDFFLGLHKNNVTPEMIATGDVNWTSFGLGQVDLVQEKKNPFSEQVRDYNGLQGYEEQVYKVFHLKDHDIFFKLEGVDDSYGESIWNNQPYQVFPQQKEITEYVKGDAVAPVGKLTFDQIIIHLAQKNVGNSELGHEDVDWREVGLGEVELVDEHGGYEGGGEDCHRVYHFKDHGVYLRIDGYYASYSGSDWEKDPYEVWPNEKVVTVFEKQ